MRIKDFLQLGYDMNLNTLNECYQYILKHYDLFFKLSDNTDFDNFVKELRLYGLLEDNSDKNIVFKNLTIESAADIINYTLENPFSEIQEQYVDELYEQLLHDVDDDDFFDNLYVNKL